MMMLSTYHWLLREAVFWLAVRWSAPLPDPTPSEMGRWREICRPALIKTSDLTIEVTVNEYQFSAVCELSWHQFTDSFVCLMDIFYRPDTVSVEHSVWPVKNWMMRCWCGMVQLMPLPPAPSSLFFIKIQNGLTFVVSATQVVLENRPLKWCLSVCLSSRHCQYYDVLHLSIRQVTVSVLSTQYMS